MGGDWGDYSCKVNFGHVSSHAKRVMGDALVFRGLLPPHPSFDPLSLDDGARYVDLHIYKELRSSSKCWVEFDKLRAPNRRFKGDATLIESQVLAYDDSARELRQSVRGTYPCRQPPPGCRYTFTHSARKTLKHMLQSARVFEASIVCEQLDWQRLSSFKRAFVDGSGRAKFFDLGDARWEWKVA